MDRKYRYHFLAMMGHDPPENQSLVPICAPQGEEELSEEGGKEETQGKGEEEEVMERGAGEGSAEGLEGEGASEEDETGDSRKEGEDCGSTCSQSNKRRPQSSPFFRQFIFDVVKQMLRML